MSFILSSLFVLMVFWRPQEWLVPQLYGWPLLQGLVYLIVLALMLEYNTGQLHFPRECPQTYLLCGLFFAVIMSHVLHFYYAGLMNAMPVAFRICFFSLILFLVLDRPGRLRKLTWIFVFMAAFMAIHAILQQERGYGFGGQWPITQRRPGEEEPVIRSLFFGIFGDPNDMGQFLCTSIPFAFCLTRRRGFIRILIGCAISYLLIQGIIASDSRGAYVALATVGAVMVVLMLPVRWFPYLLSLLVAGGLVAIPLGMGLVDRSAYDRVDFWGQANWAFRQHPIFGVGMGMFIDYIEGGRASHNAFVLCYTELGLFGYWFWFALLVTGIMGCWRTRQYLAGVVDDEDDEARWLFSFCGLSLAAVMGFCSSSYFLSRAFVFPLFFLFSVMGAIPVIAKPYVSEDARLVDVRTDVWILSTLGSLLSIVYIYISIIVINRLYH